MRLGSAHAAERLNDDDNDADVDAVSLEPIEALTRRGATNTDQHGVQHPNPGTAHTRRDLRPEARRTASEPRDCTASEPRGTARRAARDNGSCKQINHALTCSRKRATAPGPVPVFLMEAPLPM